MLTCEITHNPCGTDTRPIGRPCQCPSCVASAALDRLQARVAELENERADLREGINELDAVYGVLGNTDADGGEPAAHTIDRLMTERNSLRKALDDRFAADQRAAKAIFAETGRTSGFPSVKEVVAYFIAEADRDLLVAERRENDSIRKFLERAKEALAPFARLNATRFMTDGCRYDFRIDAAWIRRARAFLADLSADAPAQPTRDDEG